MSGLYLRISTGFAGDRDPLAPRETVFRTVSEALTSRARGRIAGSGWCYVPATARQSQTVDAIEDTSRMVVEAFRGLLAVEPEEAERVLHQLAESLDSATA